MLTAPVVVVTRCRRCERLIASYTVGIGLECFECRKAAQAVWPGIGPIAGEMSGT